MLEVGAIIQNQLMQALEMQNIVGGRIGEILIRLRYISESEFKIFLTEQLVLNGRGKWANQEKRIRKLIGEILLEEGAITRWQLKQALERQKIWGDKIGEVLIRLGYISMPELEELLAKQSEVNESI